MRLLMRFPTWHEVMEAPESVLADTISVGGLANRKAPRIKAALAEVLRRCRGFDLGFLRGLSVAEAKAWLRSLPGVGPKTAACVLLFALGMPAMPVDTHVHRVARRLGLVPAGASAEKAHDLLEAMLAPDEVYPFHVLLIKHGRRLCRAQRPLCPQCPLLADCAYAQAQGRAGSQEAPEGVAGAGPGML